MALIEVRLRPSGPWRVGHRAGDRERVDVVYHSDSLYSAVTHAMRALDWLDEWLDATARTTEPAVRLSSLFPFVGRTRLIVPPAGSWPPANPGKLYLQGAKLVPLEVVLTGAVDESRWIVDGASECMIPAGGSVPFHVSIRSAAAVDRITGAMEPHRVACLEFASNAGWWGVFETADLTWESRVKSALRLLADSGFGGERSRGWGRAGAPEFTDGRSLFPATQNGSWWLLSLFSPHEEDSVDWSKGEYSVCERGGWTDSPAGLGAKKLVRMIEEGSVLSAPGLRGHAVDVAPDGFAHPVYRAGFAVAVPLPTPTPPELRPERTARAAPPEPKAPQVESPAPEPETPEAGSHAPESPPCPESLSGAESPQEPETAPPPTEPEHSGVAVEPSATAPESAVDAEPPTESEPPADAPGEVEP